MEAGSPMGETIMETSSMLSSPQSSRLMMGLGEESMDTLTMSPRPPENEVGETEMQHIPAPVFAQEGATALQSLNASLTGSLSNVMLPAITNTASTTPILLNAASPTTVGAPYLLNQANLAAGNAGAAQLLMNPTTGMQTNTAFFLNTNAAGGNMQAFLVNPSVPGTPLVVQTPVTNTTFLLNSSVLNTSPLFLTHPSLAGSNGALMLTTNQAALAPPVPIETVTDASCEIKVQQNGGVDLNLQTVQLAGPAPGADADKTDAPQSVAGQPVELGEDGEDSSELELNQAIVEESSIMKGMEKNKDMLALRLKLRRPREELVSQGIMPPLKATTPAFHEQRQRLERAKVGDSLQRKMRMRPDKAQLVHQHILEDTTMEPMVSATHQRLKRARIEQNLDCKIKNRPGPLELIEGNILKAEHFVEQAVKDGKVKFLKTSSMETCDTSAFNFDEDSQEGCSDDPLSPAQTYSQQSDNPPSSVGSVPSPPDFASYFEKQHAFPQSISSTSSSPCQIRIPTTPSSMITIKREPGVTSPPPFVSLPNTVSSSSSSSSSTKTGSSSSSSSSRNNRKKQTKRNKPKEIKFHEYKPPNEQASKLSIPPNSSNPYNLLLMQQQLLLQLQLLQQQHQLILPSGPNVSTSKLTASNPGAQSPSSTTVSSSSSPTPQDKMSISSAKARILSNLEDMKVSELKMELKNRGLHVSGTKPQLVERLRPYADVSVSPISTASSTNHDVTSSSMCATGGTKVTSSTDVTQEVASETNSNRPSISSPPVSPPDFKSPVSASEPSEPASPGSAFDPMSPTTFQMAPPPSVSNSSTMLSVSSPPALFSQSPDMQVKQASDTASILTQITNKQTFPMEINENSNSILAEMMDVSADRNYANPLVSGDILRKQQQQIEELQRALRISQFQLQQQQTQFMQSPPPPPPPPPPPHPATVAAAAAAAASQSSPSGSPIKLSRLNSQPSLSLPSTMAPSSTITTTVHPVASQMKPHSPPKQQTMSAVFQAHDFINSLNQQQRAFSFSTPPPPSNQPFHFSAKSSSDVKPVTNGLIGGQKSSSLPSSPTDPAMLNMVNLPRIPGFSSPPPNYEEAVRQSKERKAQLGSLLNPGVETDEPRMTKSQDLDDLLEVLVDHGYQIPTTPKNKDVITTSNTRLPQPIVSLPSPCTSSAAGTSRSTLSHSAASMTTSHLSQHHGQPPPPHPRQQQQQQQSQSQHKHQHQLMQHSSPATPITITQPRPAPSPSLAELPMDVDSSDLTLSSLEISKSRTTDLNRGPHLISGSLADKDNGNVLPFDIPSMQVDGGEHDANFWSLPGDNASPTTGMLCQPSGSDADMTWLELMMPSTGSGLTTVSVTPPPTSIGAEGIPMSKEPFSLNLFDLSDDAWDNIQVTE